MQIKTLEVGQLNTNCYIIYELRDYSALIIDSGDDAEYICRIISDLKVNPEAVLATHGHSDHILAAGQLSAIYQIPFMISPEDAFLVSRLSHLAKKYPPHGMEFFPPAVCDYVKEGDVIKLGQDKLEVISLPGHTPGGIGLYHKGRRICFVGDTVFAGGYVGRTDFPYSDENDLSKSLKKLLTMPSGTRLYPGHGRPLSVGKGKQFINCENM